MSFRMIRAYFRDKLDFHGLLQRDGKSKRAALDVLLKLGLGLRPLLLIRFTLYP